MSTLTIQDPGRAGAELDLTHAAAAGGDQWLNTGKEILVIKNADISSHNVKVTVQATPDGKDVTERTITVGAGKTFATDVFPKNVYNDAGGYAQITYSAVTSVTIAVLRVNP